MKNAGVLHSGKVRQRGFTIVEIVVTVGVLGLFFALFLQNYLLLESQRINASRHAQASDVAYSNLRKFTAPPAGVTCSLSGVGLTFTPETIDPGSRITAQTVRAYPANGCDGPEFAGGIVKIESTVTYDDGSRKVTHASFVR